MKPTFEPLGVFASKNASEPHRQPTHHDEIWRRPFQRVDLRCLIRCQQRARLTSKSMSVINRINRWVNTWIIPTSDLKQWSREERWSYPDNGNGDCEDYALLKRKMLLEEGFPLQALLLTIVRNPLGDAHAVLMVRTDHGDFVLDNLTDEMLPWARTSYRFIKRQSERDPNVWLKLRNASDEVLITTRQIA